MDFEYKERTEVKTEHTLVRMPREFLERLVKKYELICDCGKCLWMVATPEDKNALNNRYQYQYRYDLDDPWMLKFGYQFTRKLDTLVIIPENITVFNKNYMQEIPLQLRDRDFEYKLSKYIDEEFESSALKKLNLRNQDNAR